MKATLQDRIAALSAEQRAQLKQTLSDARKPAGRRIARRPDPLAPCRLSASQQRLWLLTQLDPDNTSYNIPASFRIRGELDAAALQSSLNAIEQRHDILRTTFTVDEDGEPLQHAAAARGVRLERHDLSALPPGARDEAFHERVLAEVNFPLDPSTGPLWRVALIKLGELESAIVLSFHHIIFDGWSLGVFMKELFEHYALFRDGKGAAPAALPIQYGDYAEWQNRWFTGDVRDSQTQYWKERLAGPLPLLELPTDRRRPDRQTFDGAFHNLILSRPLFDSLKELSRTEKTTPFTAFLALFDILLARYTGLEDIIVGTPVAGRNLSETEPLIGIFVNTLPVRTHVPPRASFRDVLRNVRDASLDAFAHGDLAFDAIVEAVQPERITNNNPIFQVLYTYQNKLAPLSTAGLKVDYEIVDGRTAKFDLSLDVFEGPQGPTCIFEYNTGLFDRARIERMATHFEMLARSVIENPDQPVSTLQMLTPGELDEVLKGTTQVSERPPPHDVVGLIERQAAATPEAAAVTFEGVSISYGELNRQANRLARLLRERGVGAGQVVGVCLDRSIPLITTLLAILKARAAFVAMDPEFPAERLAFIAEDTAAVLLVSEGAHRSRLPRGPIDLLCLEDAGQRMAAHPDENLDLAIDGDDPAYVVYTSGTTGRPKGIRIPHRSLVNAYRGWEREYRLEAGWAHLQMASFQFDVFCGDFIRALGSGGRLTLCPRDLFADPERLYALMSGEGVACAEFVPAVFRSLADHLAATGRRLDFVKVLIVASDSWYIHEYQDYRRLCGPETRLINSYGLAEATIDSTYFEGDLSGLPAGQLVPIGKPFANVEVYVLDANLQPMPLGVPGELCIGGLGVAEGYLNQPELTSAKFVPNPFRPGSGGHLYRTGDIGRLGPGNQFELLGRRDHQVKIRGMRIELGEIETALLKHPGVRECVATVRDDAPNEKRIVAYLVTDLVTNPVADGQAPGIDPESLRQHLATIIPAYMVPSAYVELDALPLSRNGKVDRNALPAPERHQSHAFVSPRTLVEEMLASIWCQVFSLNRVSVHESFFSLGGHSLLAVQVVSRARRIFQVDLSLSYLFQHPTIAGLAAVIADLQGKGSEYSDTINALPTITPDPSGRYEPFALTEVQQAYWLGRNEIFEFGNVTTHSYDEMETVGLDVPKFEKAWNHLVQRHDMLRAVVRPDGLQEILQDVPYYPIRVLDLRGRSNEGVEAGINGVRAEMSHQMLDVHRWPVFDIRVTLLPDEKARIHFSTDALIFDVWSFVILVEELVKLYLDRGAELPPLELSFRDYVIAENSLHLTERYARALEYWQRRVPGLAPAPDLPMAMNPALLKKPKFTRLHARLEPEAWNRLKLKATSAGMTATGIMLAAYAEILTQYSRNPQFSLNLTFLNRHPMHPQVNQIIGEFTSLTMLGVDNSGPRTFVERARQIQSDLWNDLEHHDVSGVQVLRALTRAQGNATRAKMPVVFTSALVVPVPKHNPEFPIVPVYRDGVTQTSQVWLDCGVWEDDHVLLTNWDVVLELYPDGMAMEMFDAYWRLVRRLADEDDIWHREVIDLLPAPADQPARETDATSAPVPDGTLVSLFVRRLELEPGAKAVVTPDHELSYGSLGQHAAYVQRQLMQHRAGKNRLVAIIMDKGWEQIAAALGIAAAGAAYLPIDPALPEQRIRYLLEHGEVTQIVTQPWLTDRIVPLTTAQVHAIDDSCLADARSLGDCLPQPEDLAYVIFTSGSTGLPKGVMIDHRGAVNTVLDINRRFAVGAGDRVLAVSALNFDLSVYDIFGLLAAGGTIVMPEHDRRLDPTHWLDLVQSRQVTLWNSVPALMKLFTDHAAGTAAELPHLRHVLMSGDWIPVTLPDRIRTVAPHAGVTSLGGATEASIWSILYPIEAVDPLWQSIPYGKAMTNQTVQVLNHALEPCPVWVTGDLYIGGIGLALGYWRDPQKTQASFITHPRTGERLYRTGDLGRRLPDGNLEFLGRADFQVKVQGHRIELGEIEATLTQHSGIKEAVVAALGAQREDKSLAAYYVAHPGSVIDIVELRAFLADHLPDYMIPHIYHELAELPLTANGKVDRSGLPRISTAAIPEPKGFVPPRNDGEESLARIWRAILDTEAVSIHDSFFEIGGDSMMAIKMLTAVRTELQADLHLRQIFETPRIADLAGRLFGPGAELDRLDA